MKIMKSLWLLALATTIIISSCKKDEPEDVDNTTTSSQDNSLAEGMFSSIWSLTDEAARTTDGIKSTSGTLDCATITVDTVSVVSSVTINFDSAACVGADGKLRSGTIYATFTGRYRDPGTIITVTLIDYTVNQYAVEGTKTVVNEGTNVDGNLWYSISVVGASITDTINALTTTWQSSRTREWIEGESTVWWPFDDVYLIDGTADGVNHNGLIFDVEITDPLRVQMNCWWITDGALEVRPAGLATRYVDYGDGSCDNDATVTVNGATFNINM